MKAEIKTENVKISHISLHRLDRAWLQSTCRQTSEDKTNQRQLTEKHLKNKRIYGTNHRCYLCN